MAGGYDAVFQTELEKKYLCPICLAVLRDAVQTHCGHRFCSNCISNVIGDCATANCPVDKTPFSVALQLFVDNAMRREVLSLGTKCSFHLDGCTWTGELRNYEEHRSSCLFRPIECTNECGSSVSYLSLNSHLITCPRRPELCWHCEKYVAHVDMTKHQLLLCQKIKVNCLLCGCGIVREKISSHMDAKTGDCPNISIKCNFENVGCHYEERRGYMSNHYAECIKEHLSLVLSKLSINENMLRECESKLISQDDIIREQSLTIHRLSEEKKRNGFASWKIPATATRIKHETTFYTGCPGYKLNLEVDNKGADRQFINIYISLLPGDYDDELIFPSFISLRVTVYDAQMSRKSCKNFVTLFRCFVCNESENEQHGKKFLHRQRLMPTYVCLSDRFKKNGFVYMNVQVKQEPIYR